MSELKPCPFCGEGLIRFTPDPTSSQMPGLPLIGCKHCHWYREGRNYPEIEAVINSRPIESALRTQVEGLEGEVERLQHELADASSRVTLNTSSRLRLQGA